MLPEQEIRIDARGGNGPKEYHHISIDEHPLMIRAITIDRHISAKHPAVIVERYARKRAENCERSGGERKEENEEGNFFRPASDPFEYLDLASMRNFGDCIEEDHRSQWECSLDDEQRVKVVPAVVQHYKVV